jgi:hypothetical protein
MKRTVWCPSYVDDTQQYSKATRDIAKGDQITFHKHGTNEPCPYEDKEMPSNVNKDSCWKSS